MSEVEQTVQGGSVAGKTRPPAKPQSWMAAVLSKPAVFGSLIPIVTLLNAVVGMILPHMMEPLAFGEYSLVVTLFNYGLIFDLGMSQVADRQIPAYLGSGRADLAQNVGDTLLWLRLDIGVVSFALSGLVLIALAQSSSLPFSLSAGLLAALAGLANMVAQGPTCTYRARSMRRDYAVLIAILLSGLVVARLGGLILGGLAGCFAALAVWYIVCAVAFHRRMPLKAAARPSLAKSVSLIRLGIPFFATSFIWAFYVTGNRWFASFLIAPEQFGQFAFSANIFSLLVGAVGGFSAFYYPRVTQQIASSHSFAASRMLTRDLCRLLGGTTVIVAFGIVLAAFLIGLIYPHYLVGVQTARVILVAVPPMVLASWLMPVSLSSGSQPWIDGVVIYPLATVVLGLAVTYFYRQSGEVGAAWASTVAALPLIGMQLGILNQAKILRARDALAILTVAAAVCAVLALLVWEIG